VSGLRLGERSAMTPEAYSPRMQLLHASTRFRWWLAVGVFGVTLPVTVASLGVGDVAVAGGASEAGSLQRLRLCFDRWNQGRMIDWGPSVAAVSSLPRCTVSMAYVTTTNPSFSCKPGVVWPGHAGYCIDRHSTFVCELNHRGAYLCPGHVNGGPLPTENARLSRSGRLTPEMSLRGTHSTSRLAWQRRYTFRDGYIYPWTTSGRLRNGLTLTGDYSGTSDLWIGPGYRCGTKTGSLLIIPCYPRRTALPKATVGACPDAPGSTHFLRIRMRRY
jgi:hypothetical protein